MYHEVKNVNPLDVNFSGIAGSISAAASNAVLGRSSILDELILPGMPRGLPKPGNHINTDGDEIVNFRNLD